MELDGYCKELNLAFEYHGIQHYKEIDFFHRKTPLGRRRKDDETKRLLCKQNYVTLIEVPYTVQPEELQEFIYSQCVILGITVSRTSMIKLADLDHYSKNRLEEMLSFAVTRGGECLADHYVTITTPVKWRCQKGHEWETAFHYIKNKGQWCPTCAKNKKLALQDIQALAITKGGKCLSGGYVNSTKKMRWCCAKGHEWEASANDVRNSDAWCPYCAGVAKLNLGHMISMAKKYGGECLSTDYRNSKTKLRWRCAKGHAWETAPASILKSKTRTWCPYCARKAKLTIEEMQEIAKSRGGDCLSKQYINGSTKLHWRCHQGHEWMATPDNIKNNRSWCPVCTNKRWGKL